jgi:hypothetical protein
MLRAAAVNAHTTMQYARAASCPQLHVQKNEARGIAGAIAKQTEVDLDN